MSEVVQAPALGFSILANLGGNRQLTLQGFFPMDTAKADADALLDKAMGYAERLEAKELLPGLKLELAKLESTLTEMDAAIAKIDEEYAKARKVLEDEFARQAEASEAVANKDYDEQAASGRASLGKLLPKNTQAYNAAEAAKKSCADALVRMEAEKDMERFNHANNRKKFLQDIEKHTTWIAEKSALIG